MWLISVSKKKQLFTFCKPQALSGNRTMGTLIEQPLRYIGVLVQYVVLKGFELCKDDWLKLCFCRCHWPIKVPDTGFSPSPNCFHAFLFTQLSYMVRATPWSPWKALEFNIWFQGRLKSPWKEEFFVKVLENKGNSLNFFGMGNSKGYIKNWAHISDLQNNFAKNFCSTCTFACWLSLTCARCILG